MVCTVSLWSTPHPSAYASALELLPKVFHQQNDDPGIHIENRTIPLILYVSAPEILAATAHVYSSGKKKKTAVK